MENKIVTAIFKDSTHTKVSDVWQYDYGQILRIQGLDLPTAVEVDFAVAGASESIARIGTTKDGVTDVVIPDSLIETGKNLVAYIYLRDSASGNTEYQIDMLVTKRAKPEAYDRPEDKELFGQAIEAVNTAADRAEKARQTAQEAATKTGQDAEQTEQDRVEVAKMVETVTDISEQVKKVEDLSNKAQAAATKTEADAQQTAEDRVEVGKILETVKDVSEQVKTVDESVRKAKESEQAAEGHRTAVEEMKNSVEQTASGITQVVQTGVQEINSAKQSTVQEVTQTGTAQKTAVEGAGTQAVENVENVKASATEAVETAKTEAVQSVQTEGNTQTGNVTTEGTKQVKAVQDKGNEVLQSIPEDFQMQMESKLDKQQGVENKGKALVIGEDGNVAPGEVQSGGGDGIAIINIMSGESPLVIPDSAERVNKRLELSGKTEQVTTSGKNLFDPNNNYEDLVWIRNDGEIVGGSNARTSDYIPVEQGNYAFQFDVINYNQMFVAGYNTGKQFVKIVGTISKGKCIIKIDDIQIETIRLSYTRESTRIQLERSETQTPYEPYTGGKPSPSPEYPQEIKNVGKRDEGTQKYEVDAKVTGKNLLNLQKASEKVNWTQHSNFPGYYNFPVFVGRGNTVTISIPQKIPTGQGLFLSVCLTESGARDGWIAHNSNDSLNNTKLTYKATNDYIYLNAHSDTIAGMKKYFGNLQVEYGNVATPYQPYKEQTLTLTSDRPITKWDKLVEQGGQYGWLYKHKIIEDFSTLVKDTEPIYGNDGGKYFSVSLQNASLNYDRSKIYSEVGVYGKDNKIHYIPQPMMVNAIIHVSDTDTIMTAKEHMHYKVIYETIESQFVPLPQSEQNAIRALKTYYHTTVITVDGGEVDPDIKVTYTADTKNYIDNKVSAKVASIIRQYRLNTANLLSLMPMETQAAMIENDTNNILENVEEMKHE